MKYYSEITKKQYDSEEECVKAEKAYEKEQADKEVQVNEKSAVSKRKKELSDKIADADSKVDAAYKNLNDAREEATAIINEARKKADALVKEAAEAVNQAVADRRDRISDFNKEFGTYLTTYTGDKADREYKRIVNQINNMFDSFFPFNSFWF